MIRSLAITSSEFCQNLITNNQFKIQEIIKNRMLSELAGAKYKYEDSMFFWEKIITGFKYYLTPKEMRLIIDMSTQMLKQESNKFTDDEINLTKKKLHTSYFHYYFTYMSKLKEKRKSL